MALLGRVHHRPARGPAPEERSHGRGDQLGARDAVRLPRGVEDAALQAWPRATTTLPGRNPAAARPPLATMWRSATFPSLYDRLTPEIETTGTTSRR